MEQKFLEKYSILNSEQKKAVDTIDGPVFVMAGPGTGKTQILTLRIANILRQTDVDPENILALTFTNAAAYNMRERLAAFTGSEIAHRVYIATFHSFAEDMIRKYSDLFEKPYGTRLVSEVEQIEIIEKNIDSIKTEYFSIFKRRDDTLKTVVFSIGKIKGEGLTPNEFREHVQAQYELDLESDSIRYTRKYKEFNAGDIKPLELRKLNAMRDKNLELADIYEAYEKTLKEKSLYDYSDVIIQIIHELAKQESILKAELQEQFQYILVDEHQDTNDAQNNIIRYLIDNPVLEGKPNLFVVGDAKQAIFRFAGASEESYTSILSSLSNPEIIALEKNYRSHQDVLDYSHSLIKKSKNHKAEAPLSAFFDYEGKIQYREFKSHKMEILWLVQDIKSRIEKGENQNEIAVLYRNNKDAEDIRHLLDIYGISYKDFSKKNILKDSDMQKLFYLLHAVYEPNNNEVLAKSLFIDFLEFDPFDIQRILQKSRNAKGDYNKLIMNILEDEVCLKSIGIKEDRLVKYAEFVSLLKEQKIASENKDVLTFFSDFVRVSGFLKYLLRHPRSALALQKLEKLFDELKKESFARSSFTFSDSIHYLNTMKKYGITMNVTDTLSDGIQLLTFHGSKGLEFDTVYMVKTLAKRKMGSEITLPFRDFEEGGIEDERRLFYVALTRARKNCLISSFILNEEGREKTRSLHIDEIDGLDRIDMVEWEKEHTSEISLFFEESQIHIKSLIDSDFIKERFLKNNLSVSALNNYIESPLKYFFRNLIYLPETRSPFLDKGNMLHETLEKYFNKCIVENKILGKEILKDSFEKVIEKNSLYQEYADTGWNILCNYFDYYHDSFEIPIDNEKSIRGLSFELEGNEILHLSGIIDKITVNENGEFTVWDYKTGKAYSDMDKERKEKIKRQAVFYKLLLQYAFGGKYNFHRAVFDFLEPNSKGEYERQEFFVTQDDVTEIRNLINELWEKIMSGRLLEGDFYKDKTNTELLEFLEVLRCPQEYKQLNLF